MPPTRPTVSAVAPTASEASDAVSLPVATPTAAPAAAASAVSITAIPVAVSQPKKADPILTPPCSSRSRPTTSRRSSV